MSYDYDNIKPFSLTKVEIARSAGERLYVSYASISQTNLRQQNNVTPEIRVIILDYFLNMAYFSNSASSFVASTYYR